jgi:very-short-patch-repair endonuclease
LAGSPIIQAAAPHVPVTASPARDPVLATKDRGCASLLDLIDALPIEDHLRLQAILEVLQLAADYRVPMSGARANLGRYLHALQRELKAQRRVQSPIEQEMWEILDSAGLATQFVMQEPIEVQYMRSDGKLEQGKTTPDFRHVTLRVAIYCDGSDHDKPHVRERDAQVIEALQQEGYFVVRLSGRQIKNEPSWCLARVRRALASARRRPAAY